MKPVTIASNGVAYVFLLAVFLNVNLLNSAVAGFIGGVEAFDGDLLDASTWTYAPSTPFDATVEVDGRLILGGNTDVISNLPLVGVGDTVTLEILEFTGTSAGLFLTTNDSMPPGQAIVQHSRHLSVELTSDHRPDLIHYVGTYGGRVGLALLETAHVPITVGIEYHSPVSARFFAEQMELSSQNGRERFKLTAFRSGFTLQSVVVLHRLIRPIQFLTM